MYFNRHYMNIGYFDLLLEYYNDENKLFKSYRMPMSSGSIARFVNITNSCIVKIPNDFEKIHFKLSIKLNDNQKKHDSIFILDFDDKIYFKYFEK